MTNRRVIGLLGPRGSGKDTAAAIIQELLPKTLSVAFADPIRAMLSTLVPADPEEMKTPEWKASYVDQLWCDGRVALNRLGETMKMIYGPNIWIKHWLNRAAHDDGFNIVCPDVRTEYEIRAVKAVGGELWHVSRKGTSYSGDLYDTQPSVRLNDTYLLNYGGKRQLLENIRQLLFPNNIPDAYKLKPGAISGIGPQGVHDPHNGQPAEHRAGPQFLEGSGHD